MFHKEFYPTPIDVLQLMQIDCDNKIVLEPHAGKGDIIDFCFNNGAKDVLAIEINEDLQKIVKEKAKLIGSDFLECKPEQISHINLIVMNPPFSNADKHILHAYEIAPDGCEIIALCNYQTIENQYAYRKLNSLISNYGISSNLGDVFSTAERTTGIDIGLIKLYKPISSNDFQFEGFFMDEEEEEQQGEGIMQYNEVRSLVNRYVDTMKSFDLMKDSIDRINRITSQIGLSEVRLSIGYDKNITDKKEFGKEIQKQSWKHIFNKMNMEKYVTSGVMKDINKFVETQEKVPFTMKNIYKMLEIIVGTRQQTFNRALEEAVDNFTRHTHDNRYMVNGWKTNSGHMLNKKFICEGIVEVSYGGKLQVRYDSYNGRKINDLVKILCNITAKDYNSIGDIYHLKDITSNTWYEWAFFEVKFFKKGTMHIKFKDLKDWYLLNKAYGELKGFVLHENS